MSYLLLYFLLPQTISCFACDLHRVTSVRRLRAYGHLARLVHWLTAVNAATSAIVHRRGLVTCREPLQTLVAVSRLHSSAVPHFPARLDLHRHSTAPNFARAMSVLVSGCKRHERWQVSEMLVHYTHVRR